MDTLVEIDWFWMALKILAVIVLVGLNGFFVAAEFALVKIRETQLQPLVDEGQRRAKVAHYILNNLDAFLSACQLGITLASLALGWIGEPICAELVCTIVAKEHRHQPVRRVPRASFRRGTATARRLEQRAGQALTARPQHCDKRARSRQPHRTRSHATPNKYRRAGH